MRLSGRYGNNTKIPSHGGQNLTFTGNVSFNNVNPRGFNYVFPLNAFVPFMFQPGAIYRGGEATSIGHQPFNYNVGANVAYSTPTLMDYAFKPSFRGTQSAASFSISQQAMSQLLQQRSINSGR